jgi:hypothetical protein
MLADVGLDTAACRINILGMSHTGVGAQRLQLRYPGSRDFDRCEFFSDVVREEPVPTDTRTCMVRLHLLPDADTQPGDNVLDVRIEGQLALEGLDVAGEAGAPGGAVVKEIGGVEAGDTLNIELVARTEPAAGAEPLLTAIEVHERE